MCVFVWRFALCRLHRWGPWGCQGSIVAQCSATCDSVAATPLCSAIRSSPGNRPATSGSGWQGRYDKVSLCATSRKLQKFAATLWARHRQARRGHREWCDTEQRQASEISMCGRKCFNIYKDSRFSVLQVSVQNLSDSHQQAR